jgi:hypothetical protein
MGLAQQKKKILGEGNFMAEKQILREKNSMAN